MRRWLCTRLAVAAMAALAGLGPQAGAEPRPNDIRGLLPDGQIVLLHADMTWEYYDAVCRGAPKEVPTFSGFTSRRPSGGTGEILPLMVRGGRHLMSGNQFVPGSYVVAVARSGKNGLRISRWQEYGPTAFEPGKRYLFEFHQRSGAPAVRIETEAASVRRRGPPVEGRFAIFARNVDARDWLAACVFPEGGSVERCCFIPPSGARAPTIAYVPDGAAELPDLSGDWLVAFGLMDSFDTSGQARSFEGRWRIGQTGDALVFQKIGEDWSLRARIVRPNRIEDGSGNAYTISPDARVITPQRGGLPFRRVQGPGASGGPAPAGAENIGDLLGGGD